MKCNKLFKQFFDFALVGFLATIIDYLVFVLFFNVLNTHYLIATILAFVIATVFNYWASMRYVFVSRYQADEKLKEIIIFVSLSILGMVLTSILMVLTVDGWQIPANIAKILVTGVVMVFNYVSRKVLLEKKV